MEENTLKGEITIGQLFGEIDMGLLPPLVLLHGEETVLVEEVIAKIREKFLPKGATPFNLEIHYASKASPFDVIQSAKQLPLMAMKRIVIVKEADQWNIKALDTFIPYIGQPEQKTCLVFHFKKANKMTEFFNAVKSNGVIVKVDRLTDKELKGWIVEYIKKRGKKIHPVALAQLVEYCDPDMMSLTNELEKLLAFCHQKSMITLEEVQEVITDTRMRNIFNFVDKIGKKEADKILYILNRLLQDGVDPLRILGMIARQFRLIWGIKEIVSHGGGDEEVMKATGLKPFQIKPFIGQQTVFSEKDIERAFKLILEADRAIKSTRLSKGIPLERIVFRLLVP